MQKIIKVFYDPEFMVPLGRHIMPIQKFALVAEAMRADSRCLIQRPEAISEVDLLRVHSPEYVRAIKTGQPRNLAESQKFPWSKKLYSAVLMTNGGVLAAAREALEVGVSATLASGFHHAHQHRGEGFCTFNGLVVALHTLWVEGRIRRAAVLDMDLHYGNGTAQLAVSRPWLFALSLYGNDYWNNQAFRDVTVRQHEDGINHQSVALPAGCDGKTLLSMMEENLPKLLESGKPDLMMYQAGADPYYEDPYSPLQLNHADLLERDRMVFMFAKQNAIPMLWVLAGGYTQDLSKVVRVHVNTFQAWKSVM